MQGRFILAEAVEDEAREMWEAGFKSLVNGKRKPNGFLFAEREGFKPPERTSRSPDFESGPIGHSGISPKSFLAIAGAKVIKSLKFRV